MTEDGTTGAGLGLPGPDGWAFTVQPEADPGRFAQLMQVYRGAADPAFVAMPVDVR